MNIHSKVVHLLCRYCMHYRSSVKCIQIETDLYDENINSDNDDRMIVILTTEKIKIMIIIMVK